MGEWFTTDADEFELSEESITAAPIRTDATERALSAYDASAVEYLITEAATEIDHPDDGDILDTLGRAVYELRGEGFGGSEISRCGIEVYDSALWLAHSAVSSALADELGADRSDALGVHGYSLLASDSVPPDVLVLVDPRALADNPARGAPLSSVGLGQKDPAESFDLSAPRPFLVENPAGIVVVRI